MSAYLSFKLIHIAAIAVWAAGLLYLPGLFAAHPRCAGSTAEFQQLRRQTRLVYVALMSPAAVIAVISGTVLVFLAAALGGWIVLKLAAVTGMVLLHVYMGRLLGILLVKPDLRRPFAHRLLMVPAVLLIVAVITLVSWKPV